MHYLEPPDLRTYLPSQAACGFCSSFGESRITYPAAPPKLCERSAKGEGAGHAHQGMMLCFWL